MRKIALILVAVLAAAVLFTACSGEEAASPSAAEESAAAEQSTAAEESPAGEDSAAAGDDTTIRVGASPTPHAEVLAQVAEALKEKGYDLEVVEFTDYILPNVALTDGDLDANYFQHITYLNDYNAQNDTDLVAAGDIHYEPFAIYGGKTTSLEALPDGAQISVPNDPTNEARALLLLEDLGIITLDPDAGLAATKIDITENPKKVDIIEIEAAQLARSLQDVDASVINGNYAIQAGLSPVTDAMATERQDSDTAKAYTNVIAVQNGAENSDKTKALVEALQTPEIAQFMADNYGGAVVAVFE